MIKLLINIKVWNHKTGQLIRTLNGHDDYVTSLAILPGNRLASGSRKNELFIWNLTDGTLLFRLASNIGPKLNIVCLPSGNLAAGSYSNEIEIWNPINGTLVATLEYNTNTTLKRSFPWVLWGLKIIS